MEVNITSFILSQNKIWDLIKRTITKFVIVLIFLNILIKF